MKFFVYGTLRKKICNWDGVYDSKEFEVISNEGFIRNSKLFLDQN